MSKISELKNQNPALNFNLIDTAQLVFKKTKYVELFLNIYKNDVNISENDESKKELINLLKLDYKLDESVLKEQSYLQLIGIWRFCNEQIRKEVFDAIDKFIDYNERNLIQENDVTKYNSLEDILLQISLSDIKNCDKTLEKQIYKLHEDDSWFILKPLTVEASRKYGAGTKWCTTMRDEPHYFHKYTKHGNLIYCINKVTGDKVAVHCDLFNKNDISFWNIKDLRVDSMFCNLPMYILQIVKTDLISCEKSNFDLLEDTDNELYELYNFKYKSTQPIAEDVYIGELNHPVRTVQYAPPVHLNNIDINIRVNELNDAVQQTIQNITSDYLFYPNTPQVREQMSNDIETALNDLNNMMNREDYY
jgi:hypothetical protein